MTDSTRRAVLLQRLMDYEMQTDEALTAALVARWRAEFPAAIETSRHLHPLIRQPFIRRHPDDPDESWHNDVYTVTLRRRAKDAVFGTDGGMIQLGISSLDGSARHDWRDFQAIKNQLAGPECEAFELYPAESRLLDPSNYYTLWCFPGVKRLKIGYNERDVRDAAEALAPQRAFGVEP